MSKINIKLIALILLITPSVFADKIQNFNIEAIKKNQQYIKLTTNKKVEFSTFVVPVSKSLIIDFDVNKIKLNQNDYPDIKITKQLNNKARLIFKLKHNNRIDKAESYINKNNQFIIKISLSPKTKNNLSESSDIKKEKEANKKINTALSKKNNTKIKQQKTNVCKYIIVLDPGHGGSAPGATIPNAKEKNITLNAAKIFKSIIEKNAKYIVKLTRNKDIDLSLRKRIELAEQAKADLFISVHADSSKKKYISGFSVYTLSSIASDEEAKKIAENNNKEKIITKITLGKKKKKVTDILINLAQRETIYQSEVFAQIIINNIIKDLSNNIKSRFKKYRSAGFVVLKSPNIPSVLLEMGFISNSYEAKKLQNTSHIKKLGNSLHKSIKQYFSQNKSKNNCNDDNS